MALPLAAQEASSPPWKLDREAAAMLSEQEWVDMRARNEVLLEQVKLHHPEEYAAARAYVDQAEAALKQMIRERRQALFDDIEKTTAEEVGDVRQAALDQLTEMENALPELIVAREQDLIYSALVLARMPKSSMELGHVVYGNTSFCENPSPLNQFLEPLCTMPRTPGIPEEMPRILDQIIVSQCALPPGFLPEGILRDICGDVRSHAGFPRVEETVWFRTAARMVQDYYEQGGFSGNLYGKRPPTLEERCESGELLPEDDEDKCKQIEQERVRRNEYAKRRAAHNIAVANIKDREGFKELKESMESDARLKRIISDMTAPLIDDRNLRCGPDNEYADLRACQKSEMHLADQTLYFFRQYKLNRGSLLAQYQKFLSQR